MSDELLTKKDIKNNVPKAVLVIFSTLMALSVFLNSIGLNLTQINTAYTEAIVERINNSDTSDTRLELEKTKKEIQALKLEVEKLKKLSHKQSTKH